jgi:hypothetical protein
MTPEQMQQQIAELQGMLGNYKFNDTSTDVKNVSYGKLIGKGSSRRYKLLNKRLGMLTKFQGTGSGSYGVSPAGVNNLTNWSV